MSVDPASAATALSTDASTNASTHAFAGSSVSVPAGSPLVPHASSFAFDRDTAVRADPTHPGRYLGELTAAWHIGDKPNGGYLLATAARALGATAVSSGADHPHPVTITAHYLRPGSEGAVVVDAQHVRSGRTLTTVTGQLVQQGTERLRLLGAFGNLDKASGPSVSVGGPPDLPDPDDCVPRPVGDGPPLGIAESVEIRVHPNTGWIHDGEPSGTGLMEGWLRFVDGREPDVWALALFADSFPPSIFELLPGQSWVPTLELTVHVRAVPAPGWVRARFRTRYVTSGFFEEDGELWDSEGRLVALSRQHALVLPG